MSDLTTTGFSRRQMLSLIGITAIGGVLLSPKAITAVSDSAEKSVLGVDTSCVFVPEVTEGPYYFDPALVRFDITENKPGLPLELRLKVVGTRCQPLSGARVDVWHCDAGGLYSGYVNRSDNGAVDVKGETFLRGTQYADADGKVRFRTIYPGWHYGRTTHMHFKVFINEINVLTGQIFFPDTLNDAVYRLITPYSERGVLRDTTNETDVIARKAGAASMAMVDKDASRYVADLVIALDPDVVSVAGNRPIGGNDPDAQRDPATLISRA